MKVAIFAHFYMPFRNAGSETVVHELARAAVDAGHEVTAWCTHSDSEHMWRGVKKDTVLDGVTVKRVGNPLLVQQQLGQWKPQVILTHHQHSMLAIKTARLVKARSVYLVHNAMGINRRPLRGRPDLVVWNSDWVRESLTAEFGKPRNQFTFHPPLTPDRHKVSATGDAITLVNLNMDKGAQLFYDLAKAEPNRKFIGVVGGHGPQIIRKMLPNVEIMEHGPDMKRVWSQTRVLLMPSVQESYGLVAVEAGLNGIPTIAHPTDGLRENLGAGGLFADRDSVSEWQHHLSLLDGPMEYAEASSYAKTRADDAAKKTRDTLKSWVDWLG
jgi:glycosyltransferase involved in cell wall biosynthesis